MDVKKLLLNSHRFALLHQVLLVLDGHRQVVEEDIAVRGCQCECIHGLVNGETFYLSGWDADLQSQLELAHRLVLSGSLPEV